MLGGDGQLGFLWRNSRTSENAFWYLNGTHYMGYFLPRWNDAQWTIKRLDGFKTTVS